MPEGLIAPEISALGRGSYHDNLRPEASHVCWASQSVGTFTCGLYLYTARERPCPRSVRATPLSDTGFEAFLGDAPQRRDRGACKQARTYCLGGNAKGPP